MKILQVCAYAAPYEGNFMKSLYALSREIKKHGHTMIYAFPERASQIEWCQELAQRETVYFLPLEKARIRISTYLRLKKIFIAHPDIAVVHSHFELYDLPLAVVTPKKTKLFWHLHDALLVSDNKSRELLKVLQYRYFSNRSVLISASEKYKHELIDLGFPCERAHTVLNGIDLGRITLQNSNVLKEYNFLAFVWLFAVKGCDIIFDACKLLLKNGYSFKFLLIGNDETKHEFEKHFPDGNQNIFIRGAAENVNELYASSNVFVSASRAETFSYSVCEAAYAGLPVICSKIPGLEWAESLPTIDLFESENVAILYEKMKAHLDCTAVSAEDICSTRDIIRNCYSTEHWAEQIYELYKI